MSSKPDIVVTNIQNGTVWTERKGLWQGASDLVPVAMEITCRERGIGEPTTKKRTPKTTLINPMHIKRVGKIYATTFPKVVDAVTRVTAGTAQEVYAEATKAIVTPWQTFAQICPRGLPHHWSRELEDLTRRRRKAYRQAVRTSELEAVRGHERISKVLNRWKGKLRSGRKRRKKNRL